MAAWYVASRCCFKNKESAEIDQPDVKLKLDLETKLKPRNEKNIAAKGTEKKTYPDCSVHEGEFKDEKLSGQGKLTHAEGSVEEGIFEMGNLIQPKK